MTHNKKESKCCDRWEIPEAPECGPLLPEEGMKKKKIPKPGKHVYLIYRHSSLVTHKSVGPETRVN